MISDFHFKIVWGVFVCFSVIALVFGCMLGVLYISNNAQASSSVARWSIDDDQYAYIFRDIETGCEYISGSNTAAYTPRLDRNGKQICR